MDEPERTLTAEEEILEAAFVVNRPLLVHEQKWLLQSRDRARQEVQQLKSIVEGLKAQLKKVTKIRGTTEIEKQQDLKLGRLESTIGSLSAKLKQALCQRDLKTKQLDDAYAEVLKLMSQLKKVTAIKDELDSDLDKEFKAGEEARKKLEDIQELKDSRVDSTVKFIAEMRYRIGRLEKTYEAEGSIRMSTGLRDLTYELDKLERSTK